MEVGEDAKLGGPWMEGDVLVVDEARSYGHGDLVVAEEEGEYRLFRSHRVGGRCRLLPTVGGEGVFYYGSAVSWCGGGEAGEMLGCVSNLLQTNQQ